MLWLGFGVLITLLLALDLGVFHRSAHRIEMAEATRWTLVWISVGLAFALAIYLIYEKHLFGASLPSDESELVENGAQAIALYFTGYVLEKSLSIDNVFVIAVIFGQFAIQPQYQHRVLFWGILGAIVTRSFMIFGGVWLLERFEWLFYVFGGYLAFTGARMSMAWKSQGGESRHGNTRFFERVLPYTDRDAGARFVVRADGKWMLTRLALALVVIEFTDVVFALDSVPAVLAITRDPFIVLTSNVFAILGLRSLYFVLADILRKFAYLKLSLAGILVFVGAKMMLHEVFKIGTLVSLTVLLAIAAAGFVASLLKPEPGIPR